VGTVLILTHDGGEQSPSASAHLVLAPGQIGGVARVAF
jgi:hypothetical protein